MNITEIKIRSLNATGRLRAVVSITVDGVLAVHDIKVIEGNERLFAAMPSRRSESGVYRDIVHPIDGATREQLENEILEEYRRQLEKISRETVMNKSGEKDNTNITKGGIA